MSSEKCDEISLYKVWSIIWYRLPLIIICVIVSIVLGFGISFAEKTKYPVYASVNFNDISGVKGYTIEEINYFFNSEQNLEKYISDKKDLNFIKKNISISINRSTGYIDFIVSKTSIPDFWIDLINDSVKSLNASISAYYRNQAELILNKLESDIKEIESISKSQEDHTAYINLVLSKSSLTQEIADFEDALMFITAPRIGEKLNSGKLMTFVLGVFFGGVVGIILALIAGLTDRKIYLTEDVKSRHNKFVITIPEYRDSSRFDIRHVEYISTFIGDGVKNVLIFSVSPSSGVSILVEGLKSYYLDKDIDIDVTEGGSFNESPSILEKALNFDKVFIVIHSGVDTIGDLRIIEDSLILNGCRNFCYILNFAKKDDVKSVKYLPSKEYIRPSYKIW